MVKRKEKYFSRTYWRLVTVCSAWKCTEGHLTVDWQAWKTLRIRHILTPRRRSTLVLGAIVPYPRLRPVALGLPQRWHETVWRTQSSGKGAQAETAFCAFKYAKMRFRPRLCSVPRWGAHDAPPTAGGHPPHTPSICPLSALFTERLGWLDLGYIAPRYFL